MITVVTSKKANGRQTILMFLEPQEMEHLKKGNPLTVDTSNVNYYDMVVGYVPDGIKFKELLAKELPIIEPRKLEALLKMIQMFPEIHRQALPAQTKTLAKTPSKSKKVIEQ